MHHHTYNREIQRLHSSYHCKYSYLTQEKYKVYTQVTTVSIHTSHRRNTKATLKLLLQVFIPHIGEIQRLHSSYHCKYSYLTQEKYKDCTQVTTASIHTSHRRNTKATLKLPLQVFIPHIGEIQRLHSSYHCKYSYLTQEKYKGYTQVTTASIHTSHRRNTKTTLKLPLQVFIPHIGEIQRLHSSYHCKYSYLTQEKYKGYTQVTTASIHTSHRRNTKATLKLPLQVFIPHIGEIQRLHSSYHCKYLHLTQEKYKDYTQVTTASIHTSHRRNTKATLKLPLQVFIPHIGEIQRLHSSYHCKYSYLTQEKYKDYTQVTTASIHTSHRRNTKTTLKLPLQVFIPHIGEIQRLHSSYHCKYSYLTQEKYKDYTQVTTASIHTSHRRNTKATLKLPLQVFIPHIGEIQRLHSSYHCKYSYLTQEKYKGYTQVTTASIHTSHRRNTKTTLKLPLQVFTPHIGEIQRLHSSYHCKYSHLTQEKYKDYTQVTTASIHTSHRRNTKATLKLPLQVFTPHIGEIQRLHSSYHCKYSHLTQEKYKDYTQVTTASIYTSHRRNKDSYHCKYSHLTQE